MCGPRHCAEAGQINPYRVGQLLAQHGVTVLCGDGMGIMAAVAASVRSNNGMVIGIRLNDSREGASSDLSVMIVTHMSEARTALIAWSADAVIAIGGSWVTLSEIALANRRDRGRLAISYRSHTAH